jgi:2-amino-4-hydroxy-6-hydroxymethyldihydropteridine diphosphokinase
LTTAYIGIGSNLDEPRRQVEQAMAELARLPGTTLKKASSLYRTAPVGFAAQPDYVNAVAELDTELGAEPLLRHLQAIEERHGRQRSFPDAPRTLDLDLLLHGDAETASAQLTLPHPRMHQRAFVLEPLLEIAPQISIPGAGPARECLARCSGQPVERMK